MSLPTFDNSQLQVTKFSLYTYAHQRGNWGVPVCVFEMFAQSITFKTIILQFA